MTFYLFNLTITCYVILPDPTSYVTALLFVNMGFSDEDKILIKIYIS